MRPSSLPSIKTDIANVISAGSNARPRAVDTHKLKALAQWSYAPPGGYRFQSNDIPVPLGTREGFFIVEARRGTVGEQVWINRTRIGLLSKETPAGVLLYGADLGSGTPLARMRVSFIAGGRFVDRYTDRTGIVSWQSSPRPLFALAQWGASSAFISFLPQAPLPRTIVGVKTDSAVVHAGDVVHVVGFARTRAAARLRSSSGTVTIAVRSPRSLAVQTSVRLDAAGAFSSAVRIPEGSSTGDYTVMASVNGATAGTQLHVDANADGLSLLASIGCEGACDPNADVPLIVHATRSGLPAQGVRVDAEIIRSPHAYTQDAADEPWGIAPWYSAQVSTDSDGRATIQIPHPTDGLASTYGIRLSSGGATADTRIAVPTSRAVLRVRVEQADIGSGTPARFELTQSDAATGKPLAGGTALVRLMHGASVQQQTVAFDDRGAAHGRFTAPEVGSNLLVASLNDMDAMDASALEVEPQTMEMSGAGKENVDIGLDRRQYAAGEDVRVSASLPDAQGSALITLESANGTQVRVVPVNGGRASAQLRLNDALGAIGMGAAFVRDGALQWDVAPVVLDAPGRPLLAPLTLDRGAYGPGALATLRLDGAHPGAGTVIVRITKGEPSGSALFISAPDLLAVGTTATQDTAIEGASWHPWVDSTGDHPSMQTFAARSSPPQDMTMTQADTARVYWKVDRNAGDVVQIPAPLTPGKYVVSLLKIGDDGRVLAASADMVVQ